MGRKGGMGREKRGREEGGGRGTPQIFTWIDACLTCSSKLAGLPK